MNIEKIKSFVLKASQSTYASGDQSIKEVQIDKSTTLSFTDPEFVDYYFHDNYFGGEPYGGREVVSIANQPVWLMVYYGYVKNNNDSDDAYKFLMAALRRSTIDMPYRGPELFEQDGLKYTNQLEGDFENFNGIERIYKENELIYEGRYMGGLVDRQ